MGKWQLNTNKIKGALKENGMTYSDLAVALGVSTPSIQNKLARKTCFTDEEIEKTANLLGTSPLIFFAEGLSNNENTTR